MTNIYINPRQLNINTIVKKHIANLNENDKNNNGNYVNNNINSDITVINNILNNNNVQNSKISNSKILNSKISNNKYNIVKYLGEGIQGSLYLANDSAKKRYICKKILLNSNNPETIKQIELELNLLKYLSSNNVTKEYINPCIEHKLIDNNIFTIFPVFDGYSLNHLEKYLRKLDSSSYYKIVFHLIKTILHGLAKIHQYNIAHQNINNNSILVSTYKNPKEISIKFTDFGLGCGNSNDNDNKNVSNIVNIADYEKDNETVKSFLKFNSCKSNSIPISITEKVIPDLVDNDFLLISQKYDLFCLAVIFSKLLLFFENMNINLKNGYNKENAKNIMNIIDTKYL